MKGYLESGEYRVGDSRGVGDAGLILLGNIDSELMDVNQNMFKDLPDIFHESALLDRFHGFIKGWNIPKMKESLKANGWALNTEYFGEIMHYLRDELAYQRWSLTNYCNSRRIQRQEIPKQLSVSAPGI